MKMAYLGDGRPRPTSPVKNSPVKILLAALAMAFLPLGAAVAQPPTDTTAPTDAPPALPVDEFQAPAIEEPAAPPVDAAAPIEEEGHSLEDAFTIQGMWEAGDIVARSTLIIMIIMFAGTIYIATTKAVDQTILIGHAKKIPAFWDANTLDEGLDVLGRSNAFRNIAEGAIAQANSAQAGLGARIGRSDRMSHQVGIELERVNLRLQAGMAFLATVGAIAPFVGLFGTVWGIVNALIRIGSSGDPSIEKVAGPVGEALIMTAIGLGVAVPAVIFYNLLGRRNKNIYDAARHFAFDVDKLMASSAKA